MKSLKNAFNTQGKVYSFHELQNIKLGREGQGKALMHMASGFRKDDFKGTLRGRIIKVDMAQLLDRSDWLLT